MKIGREREPNSREREQRTGLVESEFEFVRVFGRPYAPTVWCIDFSFGLTRYARNENCICHSFVELWTFQRFVKWRKFRWKIFSKRLGGVFFFILFCSFYFHLAALSFQFDYWHALLSTVCVVQRFKMHVRPSAVFAPFAPLEWVYVCVRVSWTPFNYVSPNDSQGDK